LIFINEFLRINFLLLINCVNLIINKLVLIFFQKLIRCYYLTAIYHISFLYKINELIIMINLLINFFISHLFYNWVRFSSLWIDFQWVDNNQSISRIYNKFPLFALIESIPIFASELGFAWKQWTIMNIFQIICLFYYKLTYIFPTF
jgi:hypothetical protein